MNMAFNLTQRVANGYAVGIYGKITPMDLLLEADKTATKILGEYRDKLRQIKDLLLSRGNEVISGEEFDDFYKKIHKGK